VRTRMKRRFEPQGRSLRRDRTGSRPVRVPNVAVVDGGDLVHRPRKVAAAHELRDAQRDSLRWVSAFFFWLTMENGPLRSTGKNRLKGGSRDYFTNPTFSPPIQRSRKKRYIDSILKIFKKKTHKMNCLVPLSEANDKDRFGVKAFNLSKLIAGGFLVPEGFVLPCSVVDEWSKSSKSQKGSIERSFLEHIYSVVKYLEPFAVRSSGTAEDLDNASFAGQYDTVLNVVGAKNCEDALLQVLNSLQNTETRSYLQNRFQLSEQHGSMAVIFQKMVNSSVSGVAFSVNPLTGEQETVVSAVSGLGEQLVSGDSVGETWMVKDNVAQALCLNPKFLTAERALKISNAVQLAESKFGKPQDVEWAFESETLFLLQARPMTAVPERVSWKPEGPSAMFLRNFRIAEWLPEPVSPFFETTMLPEIHAAHVQDLEFYSGFRLKEPHGVVINGWYYQSPLGGSGPLLLLWAMLRKPFYWIAQLGVSHNPERMGAWVVDPHEIVWRNELLPQYRSFVHRSSKLSSMTNMQLISVIEEASRFIGKYFTSVAIVGGFAWKVEAALAKFFQEKFTSILEGSSHQTLLGGLEKPKPPKPHSVGSLDPMISFGEVGLGWTAPDAGVFLKLVAERKDLEARCCAFLKGKELLHFKKLLALAQKSALLREEQMSDLTLACPLIRAASLLLGERMAGTMHLEHPEDVFYLHKKEILAMEHSKPEDMRREVKKRREVLIKQRRLCPPSMIGSSDLVLGTIKDAVASMRSGQVDANATFVGEPASPGIATGPCKIVRSVQDFGKVKKGDILVSSGTSPAWTPLFSIVAGVITDSGSVVAHASLVAREYGIPAVVATQNASILLRDNDIVTVNGGVGVVYCNERKYLKNFRVRASLSPSQSGDKRFLYAFAVAVFAAAVFWMQFFR
jgi:phosphohistidine swiveling domain-containing protein